MKMMSMHPVSMKRFSTLSHNMYRMLLEFPRSWVINDAGFFLNIPHKSNPWALVNICESLQNHGNPISILKLLLYCARKILQALCVFFTYKQHVKKAWQKALKSETFTFLLQRANLRATILHRTENSLRSLPQSAWSAPLQTVPSIWTQLLFEAIFRYVYVLFYSPNNTCVKFYANRLRSSDVKA